MIKHKIVLVPFPFDDLSATKVHPAICLTEALGPHRHVVLAFITSRIAPQPLPTDVIIDVGASDFQTTGLRVSSTAHLHRMMTVTTVLIIRELGSLPPRLQSLVEQKIHALFEL